MYICFYVPLFSPSLTVVILSHMFKPPLKKHKDITHIPTRCCLPFLSSFNTFFSHSLPGFKNGKINTKIAALRRFMTRDQSGYDSKLSIQWFFCGFSVLDLWSVGKTHQYIKVLFSPHTKFLPSPHYSTLFLLRID